MDLGLSEATVVVNGGSKGMGRAAAETFAREGAKVAVLARGEAALTETVVALRELGAADAVHIRTDITDAAQVDAAFAQLDKRWGELNVLVNATGPVDMIGIGHAGEAQRRRLARDLRRGHARRDALRPSGAAAASSC